MKLKDTTNRYYLISFACAVVAFCAGVGALFLWVGPPGERSVEALTRLALTVFVPALISGFFAKRAATPWRWYKIAAVYVIALAALAGLQAIGHR